MSQFLDKKDYIDKNLQTAWSVADKGDLRLLTDSSGALSQRDTDLVGWIARYEGEYDKEKKEYAGRRAVGFIVTDNIEESRYPLHTFSQGLQILIRRFDELATPYEAGSELPKPSIALLV